MRVTGGESDQATVLARKHRFSVGAPASFDVDYGATTALEHLLGALGADLVNGLRRVAHARRLGIDRVEAVVEAWSNNPLCYLGVVGEAGHPGLERARVRVYLSTLDPKQAVQRVWDEVLRTSPLVHTLDRSLQLELSYKVIW